MLINNIKSQNHLPQNLQNPSPENKQAFSSWLNDMKRHLLRFMYFILGLNTDLRVTG